VSRHASRRLARAALAASLVAAALGCAAPPAPDRAALRVGTSGDYAPFSAIEAGRLTGFDLAVARAFARDRGRPLALVRFDWPALVDDLGAGRFDVAMSGVTVRPERSVAGRFGVPVATSGAVVLAAPPVAADGLAGLDRPGVRLAVNAGGHLERVTRARFPRASVTAVPDNAAVPRALSEGRADAIVTDTLEALHWQRELPGAVRLGPFTRDRKAYLWAADGEAARALDAWLLAREADGTLARLRERWLGAPGPATATPLAALLAALGERLALMPLVAEAKRPAGGGAAVVRDVAREARVLEAARQAVAQHARASGAPPPAPMRVTAFYRAQIEAAVAIQERALGRPPGTGPRFDLATALRPALLRIGDRMAWALVRLERAPARAELAAAVAAELAPFALGPEHRKRLVDAILGLVQERVIARASSPASTGSTSETP